MPVLKIRECRFCETTSSASEDTVEIQENDVLELVFVKVSECVHCPEDYNPRQPGYRKI